MQRSMILGFLFVAGCGIAANPDPGPNPDVVAAQEFVRRLNRFAEFDLVDEPEYAAIPKIPKRGGGNAPADRPAACGVRVRFHYEDGSRTTRDDWVVWVTNDHKAVDWSGNADGDNWRQYVRSFAKK